MSKLNRLAKMVAQSKENQFAEQFVQMLTHSIETEVETYTPSTYYKPSGVGGCIRKMYYERIGEAKQDKASYNLIGMGEAGTDRHEHLQRAMVRMSEVVPNDKFEWIDVSEYMKLNPVEGTVEDTKFKKNEYEAKFKNELLQLSFLCDGLITVNGKPFIFEAKTETMFKYNKHSEPFEEHKMQATCYAMCLGVDNVIFLYENRDTLEKKAYEFEVTDVWKERVIEKLQTCEWHVEQQTPPTEKCSSNYCPYCRG